VRPSISEDKKQALVSAAMAGKSIMRAAAEVGVSEPTAAKYMKGVEGYAPSRGRHRPAIPFNPRVPKTVEGTVVKMTPPMTHFHQCLLNEHQKLFAAALNRTRNKDDAEELVQQTILRCMEHAHQFTPGTSIGAWATTILKNLFLDGKRSEIRRPHVSIQTTSAADPEKPRDRIDPALVTEPSQESTITAKEMIRDLKANTTSEQRETLLRSEIGGQTYAEIARDMGVTEGTVKSRVSRARDQLPDNDARTVPTKSAENGQSIDLVLKIMREKRTAMDKAIAALEQIRPLLVDA
jgi:RNA polymerase sigma-70 factor (ECF subfamily)